MIWNPASNDFGSGWSPNGDPPSSPTRREAFFHSTAELEAAARSVTWLGLTVHRAERGGPEDEEGFVEFTARSRDGGHVYALHERSRFRREGGRWLYVDGTCRVERSRAR